MNLKSSLWWQEAHPWRVYLSPLRLLIHRGNPCMISKDIAALLAAALVASVLLCLMIYGPLLKYIW